MTALLTRVKSRLFIAANRRTWGLLDGEYASVYRGRGLDYDDLREYVPGDEIRDVDWKATARHGSPLVKRYLATRRQTVLFVTTTGRSMAALAASGEPKSDVVVMVVGLLGYLAVRHGDVVGLAAGDSTGTVLREAGATEAHLERLLRILDGQTTTQAPPGHVCDQLRHVAEHVRTRALLVVVADEGTFVGEPRVAAENTALLRRLHAQHEILWVSIEDADPTTIGGLADVADVDAGTLVPGAVRLQRRLRAAYLKAAEGRRAATDAALSPHGIAQVRVGGSQEAVPAVFRLLEKQRRRAR